MAADVSSNVAEFLKALADETEHPARAADCATRLEKMLKTPMSPGQRAAIEEGLARRARGNCGQEPAPPGLNFV